MSSWSSDSPEIVHHFEYADAPSRTAEMQSISDVTLPQTPSHDASEIAKAEQCAYETGKKDGLAEAHSRYEEELRIARNQIDTTLVQFVEEKRHYFERVEPEIVQLVLAIARRVIGREVKHDACLLGGMVRLALEQINNKTRVRVRVRPEVAELWKLNLEWAREKSIEWVSDSSIEGESCVLETDLGFAEIGIEPKLKEIEQIFSDLLSQKPNVTARAVTQ